MPLLSKHNCCTGCSSCYVSCPVHAISMLPDKDGFLYPYVDESKCVECGYCTKACPIMNDAGNSLMNHDANVLSFAAKSIDESTRMASSSGGLFYEVAKHIIDVGGVVFGCRIESETLKVIHGRAERIAELPPFQRSKYVQSDMRDAFSDCKKMLDTGREVLFTGTPCQIAGLYAFLRTRPKNLLTIDLFCHGVPSPDVFEKMKDEVETAAGAKLLSLSFRVKEKGVKNPYVAYVFEDSTKNFKEKMYSTPFYQAFINDLCLRPSCHECKFNGGRSGADMTIADFWGLELECPDLCDTSGISALLVRSDRGKDVICQLDSILRYPVRYEQISLNSRSYNNYARKIPLGRSWFMNHFRKMGLARCVARSKAGGRWEVRAIRMVRNLIRRCFFAQRNHYAEF